MSVQTKTWASQPTPAPIPIVGIEHLKENQPDVLLVFPWNLADEIKSQVTHLTNVNSMKFLRAVPNLEYF